MRTHPFYSVVAAGAAAKPSGLAVVTINESGKERQITYRELEATADRAAELLREAGCTKGSIVLSVASNDLGSLAFMIGAAKLGCGVAPAEKELTANEIKRLVELYKPSAALVPDSFLESESDFAAQDTALFMQSAWTTRLGEAASEPGLAAEMDEDDAALFVLTSGTTGVPKSVVLPTRLIQKMAQTIKVAEMSTVYFGSPAWVSFSGMFLATMSSQGTFVLGQLYDKDLYISALLRHKPSYCFFWPAVIVDFVNLDATTQRSVASFAKTVSYGGAKTPTAAVVKLIKALPDTQITQFYGSSEAGLVTSLGPEDHRRVLEHPEDDAAVRRLGSAGRGAEGVRLRIVSLEEDGGAGTTPLPVGEAGSVQCDVAFDGYYRNPEKSAAKITADGWYVTGDLGYFDADGCLYISGRDSESIVLVSGATVTCHEIEECIAELDGVVEVGVAAVRAEDGTSEVGAFVRVAREGAAPTAATVRAHCASSLGQPKFQPKHIFILDKKLPRNNNGKCLKPVLTAMAARRGATKRLVKRGSSLASSSSARAA